MGCACNSQTRPVDGIREHTGGDDAPEIVDEKVALLIAAGAAMAGNSDASLRKVVSRLIEEGVPDEQIRMAVEMGQIVKDKPAGLMMEVADILAGTHLLESAKPWMCPADQLGRGDVYNLTMLIAAGAAMTANCEPCINKAVPSLIEAGVADADIRKAVEIGQSVKDQIFADMKETADRLTGTQLADAACPEGCASESTA